MFAEVLIYEDEAPEATAAAIQHVHDEVLPALENGPVVSGLWLIDHEARRRMAIAVWETEADREAGVQAILAHAKDPERRHPVPTAVHHLEIYARI